MQQAVSSLEVLKNLAKGLNDQLQTTKTELAEQQGQFEENCHTIAIQHNTIANLVNQGERRQRDISLLRHSYLAKCAELSQSQGLSDLLVQERDSIQNDFT